MGCLVSALPLACEPPQPLAPGLLVAHALGGVDGVRYSNSYQALVRNYELGKRYFEVDLSRTRDGQMVCFHPGKEEELGLTDRSVSQIDAAEFRGLKYAGRYNVLTLDDLCALAAHYPDVHLITDTKDWSDTTIAVFVKTLQANSACDVGRIIPQIYGVEQLSRLDELQRQLGRFETFIYTLYQREEDDDAILRQLQTQHVPIVAMPTSRASAAFVSAVKALGEIYTFVHVVNQEDELDTYARRGVDGFYTDLVEGHRYPPGVPPEAVEAEFIRSPPPRSKGVRL